MIFHLTAQHDHLTTNQFKDAGSCDIQVVGDAIAMRKAAGNWGQ